MKNDLILIQRALVRWYRRSARDLPWRRTHDPYRILISEVMLQQTQVTRVVSYYRAFLKRFPSLRSLAAASPGTVLRTWRGLGYNMRALRLRKLALQVQKDRGRFPRKVAELERLPGIGPYTARAIACFAFGTAAPVLDTNVRRVFLRLFPRKAKTETLWELAHEVLPVRSAYDWNQALMELGSTICTVSSPACDRCPIRSYCPSAGRATKDSSPITGREKLFRGHARRIYRGRIVTFLSATTPGRTTRLTTLGHNVLSPYTRSDEAYLKETLVVLEKDGLVTVGRSSRTWTISLVR